MFNTPGANANAVKELVIAGMLIASRNLCQAWDYTRHLNGDDAAINTQVEKDKKQFAGFELPGQNARRHWLGQHRRQSGQCGDGAGHEGDRL